MMARSRVTSNGFFSPSRSTVSVTLVPGEPFILSMASFSGMPAMEVPSMPPMRSPDLMPARDAGVPSMGADHLDQAVFLGDFDADAAELALGGDLHVAILLGVHVAGMGIEVGNHALDGGVDQLAVLDRAHIVGAHALERVAEQVELAIGGCVIGALGFGKRDHRRGEATDQAHAKPTQTSSCPVRLSKAGAQIQPEPGRGTCAMAAVPEFKIKPGIRTAS